MWIGLPPQPPVKAISFCFRPLQGGLDIWAQPDRDGRFTLTKVRPGRYSLQYSAPGRIQTFADGPRELAPEGFELHAGSGPIRLLVSGKTSSVSVQVLGLPSGHNGIVALLAPADTHLTLRTSCYSNRLGGPRATFLYVPPGKYRILITDEEFQNRIAAYAPRFPDFMKNEATFVELSATSATGATANYLDARTATKAIQRACPEILQLWPHDPLEPLCHGN